MSGKKVMQNEKGGGGVKKSTFNNVCLNTFGSSKHRNWFGGGGMWTPDKDIWDFTLRLKKYLFYVTQDVK